MIDWVTAIIPCAHSEQIYGGRIACVTPDGEIEWQVEKKQQVASSFETNIPSVIVELCPFRAIFR